MGGGRGPLPSQLAVPGDQGMAGVQPGPLPPWPVRVGHLPMPSASHELSQIILSPPPQDPITEVIPCLQMRKLRSHASSGTAQLILTPGSDPLTIHVTHSP